MVKTKQFEVNMILDRETKGALRYQEVNGEGAALEIGAGAKIGTLYIRKDAFKAGTAPKAVAVTVLSA
jgi:hypothetical protein